MINGNVNEFLDTLSTGQELVFAYKNRKLFLQGWYENGKHFMVLDQWESSIIPFEGYIWEVSADSMYECAEAFLDAPIFDGKKFWEVERQIEWLDG
ncbi:MAG: hypothetical protein FWG88_06625 [Oscillospiraceae bacterium]|nr:hypothetical protein [Oscillospiraceae bacterium]